MGDSQESRLKRTAPGLAALGAGALSALGFAPHGLSVAMILGFAVLIRLLYGAGARRGAWYGFLFGVTHFTLGFQWLITSLHDNGGIFLPLAWFILVLLAAVMALYPALFGALLPGLASKPWLLPVVGPGLWVLTEWIRTHLFSGFPWNLAGYAWADRLTVLQAADLGGVYLLSWLILLPAAVLAMVNLPGKGRFGGGVLLLGVTAAAVGLYGEMRLAERPAGETLTVGVAQGNILQKKKWDPAFRNDAMAIYFSLTREMAGKVDLMVWPETAIPFFIQGRRAWREDVAELSWDLRAPILTGIPLVEPGREVRWKYFNAVALLNDDAQDYARRYYKHHLVPFGEYIPIKKWMPSFIKKLTIGDGDFTPGPGPVPLAWEKGRAIGVLVCYEVIFPGEAARAAMAGASFFVNVTNDGWFGEAAKPQHLAMAQVRAVENRLPMVRAANTGISAVFDAWGRELDRIPANTRGAMAVEIRPNTQGSPYHRFGLFWLGLCALMALGPWGISKGLKR